MNWSVEQRDAVEFLASLEADSADMILTDPPYMISSNIKIGRSANVKYKGLDVNLDFGEWDKQWESEEEYWAWCETWLLECARVLKPECHFVFFFDIKKITPTWRFCESKKMNLRGRHPLYWLKSNPMPRGRKVDFQKALEQALWFTKGDVRQTHFNWELGQQTNYVKAGLPNNPRVHPTQKPVSVLSVWIRYLSKPGDLVVDPFCGSGSTGMAALAEGRQFLGNDLDPKSYKLAQARCAMAALQGRLL